MSVTGCGVLYDNKPTKADPFGNNVAWACPRCKHPVLFVCAKIATKGFDGKFTACSGCGAEYTIRFLRPKTLTIEGKS